jgi:hypothetical protein
MGMRNPRIASAMTAYGFKDADLQEGWTLLNAVGRVKLDAHATATDSNTIGKLDAWENRWFPIATATLERRFPAVHAQVFKNLSQTEGPAVAVSVRTFIERFDQMAAGAGSYGAEGTQAKAVLESRGLTQAVLNEARGLLEVVGKIATVDAATAARDPRALEKAETDLWAWYLEWSQIARVAVTQRVLLRQMGFLPTHKSKPSDDEDDTDVDPTTGVITTPVAPSPHV